MPAPCPKYPVITTAEIDFSTLPRNPSRIRAAELVTLYFFETSPRSLEVWDINWFFVNGKAHCALEELFARAQEKLDRAPLIPSVRRRASAEVAA
jgi:hypothetical protein